MLTSRRAHFLNTFSIGSAGNIIYTAVNGPAVKAGNYADALNHYSLLRLIEDNWNLGTLDREDEKAAPVPSIWN